MGKILYFDAFNGIAGDSTIDACVNAWRERGSFDTIFIQKPAALFRFDKIENRTIADQSGNGWDLAVPRFPKMFRYEVLTLLPDPGKINRSLFSDIVVNFFGFFPFGGCGCLLLLSLGCSRKKAVLLTIASALFLSLGIEFWQVFIPTRSSQLMDVILNGAGAWAAGAAVIKKGGVRG